MRTGEVAARAGVNVQTLRYYERRGLLAAPRRRPSGYRVYPADAVRVVRFVKRAQALGFTLDEIESLLQLTGPEGDDCPRARALAVTKIADIERKIARLDAMRGSLLQLVEACDRAEPTPECPLLESLEEPC